DLVKSGRASTRKAGRGGGGTAAKWHWGWGYRGMGGVVTTVLDMNRWDRALRADKVLTEASKRKLFTPEKGGYAYGWKVETTERGTRKAHHSGGVAGYGTNVVRYVGEDVFFCVLSNNGRKAFAVSAAIEPLLFDAVKLAATIDVTPFEIGRPPILRGLKSLTWKTSASKREFVLKLQEGGHTFFALRAPAAYARRIRSSLVQAIRAREADDDGAAAATEASLYLQPYPKLFPKFTLTEKLSFEIQPEYRHRDGVDKRILFVLKDAQYGQWPMMALLNVAAAKELLEAIPAE
ncbi:MAG: serine hydrolase, partial [Planctomycetota bacterium]